MKKFDPEKEISGFKIVDSNFSKNSKIANAFVPILVLGCCCLAMIGVTFSYKLVEDTKSFYKINLEVINGTVEKYYNEAAQGYFSDHLVGKGNLESITCSTGELTYDAFTESIVIPNLHKDTNCVVAFGLESAKYLSVDGLLAINDNTGTSYYYPGDSTDNYLKLNNMLFRIIRINGDGTIRIMLDESDLVFNYGTSNNYLNSNLKRVLDIWYSDNFKNNKYVVSGDFDISNIIDLDSSNLINLEGLYEANVGTLSAREANLILENSEESYLGNIMLMNGHDTKDIYTIVNNDIVLSKIDDDFMIKPVINIGSYDFDGAGTKENPYIIKED